MLFNVFKMQHLLRSRFLTKIFLTIMLKSILKQNNYIANQEIKCYEQ